jgi:hypothetical protein
MFVLWKVGGHAVVGKETLNFDRFSEVSQNFPHFALKSTKREVKSPWFYYLWWAPSPSRVKSNKIKLVFAASLLRSKSKDW